MIVPITIAAKNEARAIGRMLASLRVAIENVPDAQCAPLVVLDDCTDDTQRIAEAEGFTCVKSTGGKVEAQRRGNRDEAPFNIFADADILLEPRVLRELIDAMRSRPEVQVAYPPKQPLPPRRVSALAKALHLYNQRSPARRQWFSGKLFAIRVWNVPQAVLADDMYLSRAIMRDFGSSAFHETTAPIWFRAPETLAGMYAYYSRMRSTAEHLDSVLPGVRFGGRPPGLVRTPFIVEAALAYCRARYALERPGPNLWPVVEESKCL